MSVRDDDGFATAEIGATAEQARVAAQLVRSFGQTFVFVPAPRGFHVLSHGKCPHCACAQDADRQP